MKKVEKGHSNKPYLIMIISVFFMTGMLGTRPLVPLFSHELGASPAHIGFIVGLFGILPFVLAIKLGVVVDKVGTKIPIILSALISSLALFIPYWLDSLIGIYLSQFVGGISQTMFVVALQSYSGSTTSELQRETNIMRFSIGAALGSFLGPLMGGFLADRFGYPAAFGMLASISLISVLFSMTVIEPMNKNSKQKQLNRSLKQSLGLLKINNIKRTLLISILVLLGKDIYTAYFPLLATEYGIQSTEIGIIIAFHAGAGILIRWMIPPLVERFGKNGLILSSILVAGSFFLILPIFQGELLLGIVSFFLGLGLGIGQPLSISATISALPKDRVGEGLGLRLSANRFTQISAPLLFGVIAELISIASVFWIVGVIVLFGSLKTKILEQPGDGVP